MHFLLLGAGIFALNTAFIGGGISSQTIEVTASDAARPAQVCRR